SRIDDAVVEAVVRKVGLDFDDQFELAASLVEMMKSRLQPSDESAACRWKDEAHLLGRGPALLVGIRRVEAVHLALLDVDKPQRGIALDPDWTFAKLGGEIPDVLGFARHHFSASSRPRNIRARSFPLHRPTRGK